MTLRFDQLAEKIKEQARLIEARQGSHQPLSDDDWKTLSFQLSDLTPSSFAGRAALNELQGVSAVDNAYRFVLARAPDSEGMRYGEELIASGMPSLLFAGLLVVSKEGRQRTSFPSELKAFAMLAIFYKVAAKLQRRTRIPLCWSVFGVARALGLFYRRWDANKLSRWQLQSLTTTLASWKPVLERQAGQLGAAQQAVRDNRHALEIVLQDLAVVRARLNALSLVGNTYQNSATRPAQPQAQTALASELDTYYLAFEDAHRASARDMRAGFQAYQPLLDSLKEKDQPDGQTQTLSDQPMSALDLGCGRGEWLVFLAEQGFEARGIDASLAMVAHCQAQGLQVDECDLLQALQRQADDSLNLVTAFHVAEHLDFATLYSLVAQAWRVLKPGGALLLETPNPENPLVGSHTFYHDPTHRNPLTPSAMHFLLGYHGFDQVEVLRLNPYPESARVPGDDLLTERINGLLCGPQDFAVVGRRPTPPTPPSQPSPPSMASTA